MKKTLVFNICLFLILGFLPACGNNRVIRFQLKVADSTTTDYYICAERQEIKQKLNLENAAYTEGVTGALPFRIYDVTVKYPAEAHIREDGRSFWTFYMGYASGEEVTFSYSLKNVGIRSGHTTVDMIGGGKVLYDTVKTVYSGEDFTLYADEGMEGDAGSMLYDTQFVWYEKEDGDRVDCGSVLTAATIKLLGQNTPTSNGNAETWFSVISGAEGVGEIDRFCVTTKVREPQPECTLTYADLPEVTSEKGAEWLDDSEFAENGIKPGTDSAAMKAAFGEPVSSRGEYEQTLDYTVYQYDGVIYKFITGIFGQYGWEAKDRTYQAEFTKNLVTFPRGIKIGDSFKDALKKFPQEMDYKADSNGGLFYGDYWTKYGSVGWGAVRIINDDFSIDNGVWILVVCDEYWPMLQVHFTEALIADKIVVQFSAYPYG